MSFDVNSVQRIGRSCAGVGYKPLYATAAEGANLSFTDIPNLNGLIVGMPVLPWYETGNPQIVQYQAALKRFAPGLQADSGSVIGWVSAKMFEAAAMHMPDIPTSRAVLDGIYGLKGSDLGGLTMPLTFTAGQDAPATFCYWIAQVQNGNWVSPVGGGRFCS
jgi:branched-chain amino acid transport system substrate-binding protein